MLLARAGVASGARAPGLEREVDLAAPGRNTTGQKKRYWVLRSGKWGTSTAAAWRV